jgi:hypothetical protein
VVLGVAGLFVAPTQATDEALPNTWIQISPVSSRINLSPSQVYNGTIKITNVGAENFSFKVYASSYGVTDLDYEPTFDSDSSYTQLAKWVSFEQTEYKDITPNQTLEIPYVINVPENSPGGGQYAVLFAETLSEGTQSTASASITTISRVGSLLFADLGGESRMQGEVSSFEQSSWIQGPIKSEAIVKNDGNIDFVTQQTFTVRTLFGREVYSNSASKYVLPETSRKLDQQGEETPALGLFSVNNKVSFINGDQVDETKLVLVGPVWAIITILVISLLILILIVLIIVKKVKKTKGKKVSKK